MKVLQAEKNKMLTIVESEVILQSKRQNFLARVRKNWGHVIVMATFFLCFMFPGFMFNYNLLFLEFERTFNATTVEIGLPGTISLTVFGLASPLTAFLFTRAGHRNVLLIGVACFAIGNLVTSGLKDLTVIAIVYGGLVGFAVNVVCLTASHMIVLCFEVKHVSLSTGIGVSGIGAGLMVSSPAISWIYAHLGWRQSLRLIAAAYGIIGLLCSYVFYLPPNFKPKDRDDDITKNDSKGKDKVSAIKRMKSLVKCPIFWSTQVVFFICTLVIQFLYISVGNYMRTLGTNDGEITLTSTLMGVGDLLGRLLMAFATDNICISRTLVYAFNSFFGGILMFYLLIPKSTIVTSLIIAGLCIPRGTVLSMMLPVTVELFGKESAVEAISIAHFVTGFACLVAPVLSDTPFDKSGSYNLTIFISGILFIFAGFLMTCVELMRQRRNHRKAEDIEKKIRPKRIQNSIILSGA